MDLQDLFRYDGPPGTAGRHLEDRVRVQARYCKSGYWPTSGAESGSSGRWAVKMVPLMSENEAVQEAITRDPEVMHGIPVFRGTRVPVQTLFDYLESGESLDDFLEGFPTVDRKLAVQVLEERKELRLARV